MSDSDNRLHVDKVQSRMIDIINNLANRAKWHDASKFHEPEKSGYEKLHERLTPIAYGTPEYKTVMVEFKWLLDRHFSANDHHPEHHDDGINDMNLMAVMEMLADWKAASERPQSTSTLAQGLRWNFERFKIGPQLAQIILNTTMALGWVSLSEVVDLGLEDYTR